MMNQAFPLPQESSQKIRRVLTKRLFLRLLSNCDDKFFTMHLFPYLYQNWEVKVLINALPLQQNRALAANFLGSRIRLIFVIISR